MKIKIYIALALAFLATPLIFYKPPTAEAATAVNLFQITTDGSQQKDPLIYKNLVAYDWLSDIWGFNLRNKEYFTIKLLRIKIFLI